MPTYKNSGTAVAFVGGSRIEAGETLQTAEWFATLPTGVTQTAEFPMYSPIIYSAAVSSTGSYTIPTTVTGNYKITFTCASGSAAVKLSSVNNTARVLVAGDTWTITCLSRTVCSLIWTITTCSMSVTVETI